MLGMMMNVSLKTSDALKSMAQEIIKASVEYVTNYDDNIKQRSYGLISRLISYSEECINIACQHFLPMHIMHLLPDGEETTLIHAVKILAVVTRYNEGARKTVVECDPELKVLRASLGECEDIVVADSALCIANMCQDREICVSLVDTNIIQELLARTDSLNSAIKQNCAIAVAKLVSNDVRHMKKLKEHNGFDILHSCVKHLKS
uniref:Uncharacterized protein LOC102807678 n=1 Tax=Saccoglossus kowalevskii TaxID=10224 RepID=A0ABM0LYJ5_SACKO|nr:PREDICTED: uncharacterized protein LOC102807678 [Saccoglossus kowalevskii]